MEAEHLKLSKAKKVELDFMKETRNKEEFGIYLIRIFSGVTGIGYSYKLNKGLFIFFYRW